MSSSGWPKPAVEMQIDGVEIAAHFGSVQDEVRTIRNAVGLTRLEHLSCLRLSGRDVLRGLEQLVPCDLFVRDGQLRQSLLLRPDATVLADIQLGNDDDCWLLIAEGVERQQLIEHVRTHSAGLADFQIEDLSAGRTTLSLNGPFAWELMAEMEGEEIIAFPYLSFYRPRPESIYLRTGKTGEFGYDLLVPRAEAEALEGRILALADELEIAPVGMLALWCCALENWFFNVHREGRCGLTPVELGLQWRVNYDKEFVGGEALRARRRDVTQRITALRSAEALKPGDSIMAAQQTIGQVLHAEPSLTLGGWVGIGLLDMAYAHSGIDVYRARRADGPQAIAIETVSAPFVNNLSLYVNPQRHSISDREAIGFPGPDRATPTRPGSGT